MEKIIVTTHGELANLIQESVKRILDDKEQTKADYKNQFLNLNEAAAFLNLSPQTLYGFTSKRKIPFIKKGKKLYFKQSDLEKWLETGRKKSKDEIDRDLEQK